MFYSDGMWEVEVKFIEDWLLGLPDDDYDRVFAAIGILRDHGPALGRPLVDTIKASQHKNMKELRPGSGGRSTLRILFAFDPRRQAIMLVAGDKTNNWDRWYRRNIPRADSLLNDHLKGLEDK